MRKLLFLLTGLVLFLSTFLLFTLFDGRRIEEKPSFSLDVLMSRINNRIDSNNTLLTSENAFRRLEFSHTGLRYLSIDKEYYFGYQFVEMRVGPHHQKVLLSQPKMVNSGRVQYSRGWGITEDYLSLDAGVEQLFVIDQFLGQGDLVLVGQVDTNLQPHPDASGGIRFLSQGMEVLRYGAALAFDAAGSATDVRVTLEGQSLSLTVPGDWLATAVYPVTVDPFIGGDILISEARGKQMYPATAYNDDDDEWLVVWEDDRDGNDDIYAQRVNAFGTIIGDPIVVWDNGDELRQPDVAYDTTQGRYFVVWQNETDAMIEGRVLNADGSFFTGLTPLLTGVVTTSPRTNPQVAYNVTTDEYLVIWQEEIAAGNHDINGRKVDPDGIIDPGGAYTLRQDSADDIQPTLIANPSASGDYLMAWASNKSGSYNILGRRLDSAGVPYGLTFAIANQSGTESSPALALNTDNGQVLAVWTDNTTNGESDIYGRLVNSDGSRESRVLISDDAGHQYNPSVTYNYLGDEFFVVWDNANDLDGRTVPADTSTLGTTVDLAAELYQQEYGAIAFGADRYLVVWHHYDSARNTAEIVGQRLDQAGTLAGVSIDFSPIPADQSSPALAFGSYSNTWLVVWEDDKNGNSDIYGQFVTREGLLLGDPLVICNQSADQITPDVAYNLADDEFLVVWADARNINLDIYLQRVDASNGTLLGITSITSDPDDQGVPAVAYSETANQYLVVWQDARNDPGDGSNLDIYGRRLNADGTHADGFVLDICQRSESQLAVDVAYNPVNDQYLVVWSDESMVASGSGLAGQRIDTGTPWRLGTNFDISTGAGNIGQPSVACNTVDGEYLVAWQDDGTLLSTDIFGRLVDQSGGLLGSGDISISTTAATQLRPNVSFGPNSELYYVAWHDNRNTPAYGYDIYGQAISTTGDLLYTDADTNVPAWVYPGSQIDAAAVADPSDDLTLVVWEDGRNGLSTDIYGRLGEPLEQSIYLPLVLK